MLGDRDDDHVTINLDDVLKAHRGHQPRVGFTRTTGDQWVLQMETSNAP